MHLYPSAPCAGRALFRPGLAALFSLFAVLAGAAVWGVFQHAREAERERFVMDRMLIVHDGVAAMWHP